MVFTADHRNYGGRDQIIERIQNHHNRMMKMKSSMNTRVKPKKHVDYVKSVTSRKRGKNNFSVQLQSKLMHSPEFSEVRETFRRVYFAKPGTDNKKPKTMKYRETFLKNKKKNLHELDEHYKNLTSLQRRLGSIGSPDQRKKNPYDPIAHPSLFFRRVGENDKRTNLEKFATKVNNNYKVNKAIHDFNKVLIENDYHTNVRNIVKGGMYSGSSAGRSRKHLSSVSNNDRPYSANPNAMGYYNPYSSEGQDLYKATDFTNEEEVKSATKKRPKTGKTRSVHEEEKYVNSEYTSPGMSSSGKKKRLKSAKNQGIKPGKKKTRKSKAKKKSKKTKATTGGDTEEVDNEDGFKFDVPIITVDSNPEAYEEVKQKLRDVIVLHRIVKDEDLNQLFEKTKEVNEFDEAEYEKVVNELKAELDNEE